MNVTTTMLVPANGTPDATLRPIVAAAEMAGVVVLESSATPRPSGDVLISMTYGIESLEQSTTVLIAASEGVAV